MAPKQRYAKDRTMHVTPDGRAYLLAHGLVTRCGACGGASHRKPRPIASDGTHLVVCSGSNVKTGA